MRLPRALFPLLLVASGCAPGGHEDVVTPVLVGLLVVLAAAKLGGELAVRSGQPSVLGELLVGVALGGLVRVGLPLPDLAHDATIDMLARLGVVVLLFEVGLESTVPELLSIGGRATLVAVVGVVLPIVGGLAAGPLFAGGEGFTKPLFLGAALCATSVGITARVFRDLGFSQSRESKLILGAAVVDDVLGLVVLSLVTGLALATGTRAFDWRVPLRSMLLAGAFLAAAIGLGPWASKGMFRLSTRMRSPDLLLPFALAFAFGLSALAGYVELAPIVGAYAAGLILERAQYQTLIDRGERELEELVHPIGQVLTPIFFVVMGARVDLFGLGKPGIWLMAGVLVALGIATKLACGLAAPRGVSRLTVGLGMIPRGEVGLIFADVGRHLVVNGAPLLTEDDFSALVLMVIVTTLVTPPLLGLDLRRRRR